MQLIVAEKPSVARDLARVLGVRPTGQHCFEGDGRVITWCVGHLVELDEPVAYDPRWKAWRLDTLPMVPAEFRLRPARHAMAQLRAVTRLLTDRRFTSVVNACDAGREGELIFRYLYQFAGKGPPVQRLWISSLTDEAIRKGFAQLRPAAQLDPLADAARARSEADWLVGMNATRAVTVRGRAAGHTALYSIGRVQTPTLAMLVSREQAIRAFVPRPYWEVRGEFRTAAGQRFTAGWRYGNVARLATAEAAEAITARDTAHGAATDAYGPRVERLRARTVREPAPLLFDLTSLQRTANRRFGMSAARTLEIAQALYEQHKILTYPRTDSRHLSSDVARELPALFQALAKVPAYAPFAGELVRQPPRPSRRVIDDAKVHDHHAIIPTGKPVRLDALDHDERRLFDLVARRFLAAFYPDAEFAITEAWIRVGAAVAGAPGPTFGPDDGNSADKGDDRPGRAPNTHAELPILDTLPPEPDRYLARGRVRLAAGWQAVAGIDGTAPAARDRDRDRDDPDGESASILPPLVEGQPLDGTFKPVVKHTTPPPRYTEATLLGAMESAGKTIDDEALRAAMKDAGLGTPATRAAIIETLLKRDYLARTKQQLTPTALGIALIEALPVASLASPELTGAWEARLARIARGEDSRAAFMADIVRYVTEMVDTIRGSSPPTPPAAPPIGRCPRCDASVIEGAREFICTDACGFTMQKRVAGRAITAALAGVLLERRKSQILRGFRSKAGKPFAAMLVLDDDGALRFDFAGAGRTRPPDRSEPVPLPDPPPDPGPHDHEPPPRRRKRGRPPRAGDATRDPATPSRRAHPRATGDRPATGPVGARTRGHEPDTQEPRHSSAAPTPRRATPDEHRTSALLDRDRPRPRPRPTLIAELACPRCHQGTLITGARGWGCSRWRDGCRFVVWFETAGRRLSAAQLHDLVTRGKTRKARFVSDRGVELDGRLVLDPAADGGNARLEPC
ncbi:MAG TPA: DNA topoisomerase [Kofleriaceae bacterium]|nr:DNA topoisomerase [Kofleriaceae bacterium]